MVTVDVVSAAAIKCREIGPDDIEGIANLLTSGFCPRTPGFWMHALKRLSEHATPAGFPKYGYLLNAEALRLA